MIPPYTIETHFKAVSMKQASFTKKEQLIGAAYIRVSTNDQLELSPESQLQEILRYAEEKCISLQKEFIFMEKEGRSGKRAGNRPEFQRMIATAKTLPKPFDVILVWKFSRFARNQDESTFYKGMLRKKLNIDIQSVSEPILDGMYGRLIELIIEWQDEFYSYNLSAEVRRGMEQKARCGGYQSSCPYGYRHITSGEPPAVIQEQAKVVRHIFSRYLSGNTSFSAIAKELNRNGCKTRTGKEFEGRTVSYILQNPFYTGCICWNRLPKEKKGRETSSEVIVSAGRHEALVSMADFKEVERLMGLRNKKSANRKITGEKHFLSGLLICPICHASLVLNKSQSPCFQCWRYAKGLHEGSASISEKKAVRFLLQALGDAGFNKTALLIENPSVSFEEKRQTLHSLIEIIVFDRSQNRLLINYHV